MTTHRDESIQKLAGLIHDIEVAMVTTEDDQGELRSRPMATQKTQFDGTLWFFTYDSSPKVAELRSHEKVNVSYSDPRGQRYVSVSGIARITRDPDRVRKLWSPALKAWFPQGKDDPAISLIEVEVQKAEFWEATSGRMVQLAGFVQAVVTGKRADNLAGRNEKLDLTG